MDRFSAHIAHVARHQIPEDFPVPAPDGTEIRIFAPPGVYHPGDGSSSRFLLAELPSPQRGSRMLDMGCGTGVIGIYHARGGAMVTAVDVDDRACCATAANAARNGVALEVLQGNLWDAFAHPDAMGAGLRFDKVVFNAPLLDKPLDSPDEAPFCDPGFSVLRAFLADLPAFLADRGEAFVLTGQGAIPILRELWRGGLEILAVQPKSDLLAALLWRLKQLRRPRRVRRHTISGGQRHERR